MLFLQQAQVDLKATTRKISIRVVQIFIYVFFYARNNKIQYPVLSMQIW